MQTTRIRGLFLKYNYNIFAKNKWNRCSELRMEIVLDLFLQALNQDRKTKSKRTRIREMEDKVLVKVFFF